ncbi:MAG: hypothetical protein sL5_06420 [Candidatus Mesenet longicola]|uniref:Uncharacterized protein n=1 Tax=Candidatus Mesenet longicola TaxID=1892558 RepID=A0A8J3HPE0_9RICK|nr:MAG: hypothetical protein sGL2_06470 [Candidatus Mesenet longicola]GHM59649.1 MAG: hypothetical protein sL5_06420 [Candidatus Mesenet longicola]
MATWNLNQLAYELKKAIDNEELKQEFIKEKFAPGLIEANQSWEEKKRNSFNEQSNVQNKQNSKTSEEKKKSIKSFFSSKPKKEQITLNISSPIIYTGYTNNAESVLIQPFRGKSSSPDSRRTSVSSNASTFSSDSFESDVTKDITAKNISTEESFESFENKKSHNFIYEGSVGDMLSSLASNDTNHNSRSLSSFTTFSDTESTSIEGNKSKRRISVDSGIGSSSDLYSSNESLSYMISQDTTKDSEDKKISTNESSFASIRKSSIQGRSVRLAKKVALPTIPILKSNILNSEKLMGEEVNSIKEILFNPTESLKANRLSDQFTSLKDLMPLQEKMKEISRKDQLSSKIDKFIPQVNLSTRKTVEERVKYGTLDMLKVSAERLNLKINKVDSLLKSGSLVKVDKNNNSEVLLVTKKDTSLLKELKRDLKRTLYGVNKQLFKETKKILAHEQREQQELQDKILKGDIAKIKEVISTAKSKTNLEERSSLLNKLESDLKIAYSHSGKNLDSDLKKTITELRTERWASQTNIWAIRSDDIMKNYLPESRVELTFAEKKEIFSCKRDAAKSLLDSQQYKGEDKEILKGLHKLYSNLAKSSEDKPKEKSSLEYAFNNEFRDAYKESYETRLKEFGSAYQKSCSTKLSEVLVSQLASSLSK